MSAQPASSKDVGGRVAPSTTWPHQLDHDPRLRVGDVIGALAQEFPSLTPSKLRFLDAQGLVTPRRTGAGYRLYSSSDVERLRFVLRQQRDAFAPLHHLRDRLGSLDGGADYEPVSVATSAGAGTVTAAAVALEAECPTSLVSLLVAEGIVTAVEPGVFDRSQAALAVSAARYVAAGADIREARALVRVAQREADASRALAAPRQRRDDASEAHAARHARSAAAVDLFRNALAVEWDGGA